MNVDLVKIKQIPDDNAASFGLDRYGRSKMPNTFDVVQVAETEDKSGVFITGLDEQGLDLLLIKDPVERAKESEERKNLRLQLERYTGKDLSATSNFWRTFIIPIDPDGKQVLNRLNPLDVIKYHALIANAYVAPNEKAASLPRFKFAKYYFQMEDIETEEQISTVKKRDKARAELLQLDEDKDKLILIGQFLEGGKYKQTMKPATLYKLLSDYINDTHSPEHVDEFLRVTKLPTDELKYKVTVDTAIRKRIIRHKDGYYYFGASNLGRNAVDVLKNLRLPEFSNEFIQIDESINNE